MPLSHEIRLPEIRLIEAVRRFRAIHRPRDGLEPRNGDTVTGLAAGIESSSLEQRTVRKIAWRIVPFLMLCYFVSFVDRVNVGFAALQMNHDLHLSPVIFGFGGGLFFLSYFFCEVPSNLLLQKIGARLWIARIMITWGLLAAGMAFVVGPRSFYAMRLSLGAAEAGFFPGVILYLTYWLPRAYYARMMAMFTVAIPVSSFLGSPISAALLGVDGWLGLRGWQWMFILEGIPAVFLGLACFIILSNKPADAKWLTSEERAWIEGVLDAQARGETHVGKLSLWQVLCNKYVLILSVVLAGSTAVSSGLQIWQPQIIKSYGLTNFQTGLLNAIPFGIASMLMVVWGRRSDVSGERVWHTALPLILTAASLTAALVFNSLFSIVVILCLAVIGIYAGKGPVWALASEWLSTSTAAAGLAQINAISNLAGFGTTYVIGSIKQATGSYPLAMLPLAGLSAAGATAILLINRARQPHGVLARDSAQLHKGADSVQLPRRHKTSN